jgi:hypothetical protein
MAPFSKSIRVSGHSSCMDTSRPGKFAEESCLVAEAQFYRLEAEKHLLDAKKTASVTRAATIASEGSRIIDSLSIGA